jgi:hypothetical protein
VELWSVVSRAAAVGGLLIGLVPGCRQAPSALETARSRVSVGTKRDEAIQTLGATSWYHQPCWERTDLFFYGSHEYDRAEIVILRSDLVDGEYVVVSIDGFESYAWQTAYADCIQRGRFEE